MYTDGSLIGAWDCNLVEPVSGGSIVYFSWDLPYNVCYSSWIVGINLKWIVQEPILNSGCVEYYGLIISRTRT
jgi:hypothetical protein